MIVIEAHLQPGHFFRVSLLRHIQRTSFYFYALTAAGLSALAYTMTVSYLVLLVAWIPFVIYLVLGLVNAIVGSRRADQPYFLPTRYEFGDHALKLRTIQGASEVAWDDFREWRKVVGCYVLYLNAGAVIAIPLEDVTKGRESAIEGFLKQKIPV
ncbi:YcxB family protein [Candidatus Oscillochloris fontis]|uniref:YcxB family protein n=1 Tax=Candidatus Oscillochloris fontis TaxID=2496868 RepID=UPI00101D0175|nr:YcxB family protein [Candidatus Oscillochloris fontis]